MEVFCDKRKGLFLCNVLSIQYTHCLHSFQQFFLFIQNTSFSPYIGLDKPPYDGYPESSNDGYNIILFSFCNLLVAIGFIFSIVCVIFNFTYRNKK